MVYYFFFFFQAEDGIRDIGVDWSSDVCSSDLQTLRGVAREVEDLDPPAPLWDRDEQRARLLPEREALDLAGQRDEVASRSEERRVGEEGRSRWSPYH